MQPQQALSKSANDLHPLLELKSQMLFFADTMTGGGVVEGTFAPPPKIRKKVF